MVDVLRPILSMDVVFSGMMSVQISLGCSSVMASLRRAPVRFLVTIDVLPGYCISYWNCVDYRLADLNAPLWAKGPAEQWGH